MANTRPQHQGSTLEYVSEPNDRGPHADVCYEFASRPVKPKLRRQDLRERFAHDLEAEIIPRLMLAHAVATPPAVPDALVAKSSENRVRAGELAHLAIATDTAAVTHYIEASVSGSMALDEVLVEIVGGAARHMGELWESDDLDFVEVTIGVSRLQQALRLLSERRSHPFWSGPVRVRKAAFVPAPGDQHTFGLLMVCEAFRCAGWDVWGSSEIDTSTLIKMAATEPIDLAGFSLSFEHGLDRLIAQIDTLRASSCSPGLVIIVGGNAFLNNPDLWKSTRADAMARDAIEAIRIGEKLVKSGQERRP